MRIAVVGIWHLGAVYAACLAELGNSVVAVSPDESVVNRLNQGQAPIFEPGLDSLLERQLDGGRLRATSDVSVVGDQELVWLCADTLVREDETADPASVERLARNCLKAMTQGGVLIVSSQVPLGTGNRLQLFADTLGFGVQIVCCPENLRLGSAITCFMEPDRIVIGADNQGAAELVRKSLVPLETTFVEMSIRSAELTKHALNAFLATSVAFANELSRLAAAYSANADDVYAGLASDKRIGPRAYLLPGAPIAGGTLLRDIEYLTTLASNAELDMPTIGSVKASNTAHKHWALDRVTSMNRNSTRPILIIGLVYKSGTDTLRRSLGLELVDMLARASLATRAFDSQIKTLPERYSKIPLDSLDSIRRDPPTTVAVCSNDPELDKVWSVLADSKVNISVIDICGAVDRYGLEEPDNLRVSRPGKAL